MGHQELTYFHRPPPTYRRATSPLRPSLCRHYLHHRSPRTKPSILADRPTFVLPHHHRRAPQRRLPSLSATYQPPRSTPRRPPATSRHQLRSSTPFTADTRPPHFTITITACPSRDTSSPAAAAIADDRQGEEQQHAAAVLNRSLPPFSRRRRRYFIKGVEIEAKLRVIGSWVNS
ncbi:hypothetical protein Dimus_027761 [Dionaea muscipula]